MPSQKINLWLAVLLSLVALGAMWFVFELRYMWFVNDSDFYFLRIGFGIAVVTIIALWIWSPSRILVPLIGFVALAFPPLLRGGQFVALDGTFTLWLLVPLLLLVVATQLNRMARVSRPS